MINTIETDTNTLINARGLLYRYKITKDRDLIKNCNKHLRNNNIVM